MAETAVGIVTDKLIPLVRDEVKLLKGVHGQVEWVKDQLLLIQAFLKDADAKAEMTDTTNNNNTVKEWVKQLREVVFRIEDVMDLYLLKVAKRRRRRWLVAKIDSSIRSIKSRHEIASDIEDIKLAIQRLTKAKETLGLSPSPNAPDPESWMSTRHELRIGAHFTEDAQLVGVDNTRKQLNHWLESGESRRTVIAIAGEGGLGKTTIAKNVYDKQKEKSLFNCYAWITVSRSLKVEPLLKTIMQSLYEEDGNEIAAKEISETMMSKEALIRKLREHLQGRSYMIVFDDVWEQNFWEGVQFALPIDSNGRIIITTRDTGVAEFCKHFAPVNIHELKPLPPKVGLKLFHNKAFQFAPEGCPKELMELSEAFVKKCEGVPLAIEAIAGLLSTKKKTASEWQKVYGSLHSKLSSDPHLRSFYQVLSESYHDLPCHLKSCLLYFGLFPEDYSILGPRLFSLWVAEGFIKKDESNDQSLEEAAKEYLNELIRRSLVKVSQVNASGRVQSCRVHDLMHTFIMRKCEELNFCQVMKNEEFRFLALSRRLSVHKIVGGAGVESVRSNYGRVRSCVACDIEELPRPVVKSFLSSFKLLVALDFENSPLDDLPEPVGMLLNLKYLNLTNTKIKKIPKFIGKLQNLEILNLIDTQVSVLPEEISKLVKLRHLLAGSSEAFNLAKKDPGVKLNRGIGSLTALRNLAKVDAIDREGVIQELKKLKKLRVLGIEIRKIDGNQLCSAIETMNHLRRLLIWAADEEHEGLELQSLVDPPPNLELLFLHGRLENLPNWIPKLKNLTQLWLCSTALVKDPLPDLKSLSELVKLTLDKSYDGDELHFQEEWFTKIKTLSLRSLPGLKTLKIDEKALPQLEELYLWLCPQMVQVPADIQNLESLKKVVLIGMPREFVESTRTQLKKKNIALYTRD